MNSPPVGRHHGASHVRYRRRVIEVRPDPELLLQLARARMPFGKYEGLRLIKVPEPYLLWFARKGFPRGVLGQQMALALELKINGLESLIEQLDIVD